MKETKDRVIKLRIEPELANRFKARCKGNMSNVLRKLIEDYANGK